MKMTTILFLFVVLFMSIGEFDYAKASETREIYIIAREGEQIYSITDLKKKRVCLGPETHHGERTMIELGLKRVVDYEEVKCYEYNYHQLLQKLMNKEFDAFFFVEETPIFGLADSLKNGEVIILSYTEELIAKLKKYGPYEKRIISYKDYSSLKKDVFLASMIFIKAGGPSSINMQGGLAPSPDMPERPGVINRRKK